jgi:threonine synthase
MKYISTRAGTAAMPFMDAVMTGQAPDGGLLLPQSIPNVTSELSRWSRQTYSSLAFEVMRLFTDDIPEPTLARLIDRSYATFDHDAVTPVKRVGPVHVMELFHGPTLAFKDVALQLLGNLFEHILALRGQQLNILGATSGDTGSAGIAGVRGKTGVRIFVMYPEGKTSPVQERQMTSVIDDNVHCLAVDGSFDDCQGMMKNIFNDLAFKQQYQLGAINSINCARLLAQVVYYFYAYFRVVEEVGQPVSFSVPTGNFGDIFAGYVAREMGLPIEKLILATNENDILREFFATGLYRRGSVHQTLSPSMDIQVASNFERYLYYRLGGDASALSAFMKDFGDSGRASLGDYCSAGKGEAVSDTFAPRSIHRDATLGIIERYYREHDYLLDPHTAVGVGAAEDWLTQVPGTPVVCLATAHPAKFPEAIEAAIGTVAGGHERVEALAGLETRTHRIAASVDEVRAYIERACD